VARELSVGAFSPGGDDVFKPRVTAIDALADMAVGAPSSSIAS